MDKKELIEKIRTVIDMEQRSASMAPITPLYVSRMLNVPLEEVEEAMESPDDDDTFHYDDDDWRSWAQVCGLLFVCSLKTKTSGFALKNRHQRWQINIKNRFFVLNANARKYFSRLSTSFPRIVVNFMIKKILMDGVSDFISHDVKHL